MRPSIARWSYILIHLETMNAEPATGSEYLAFKERLVGENPDDRFMLEVDLHPFAREFPKMQETKSIGRGSSSSTAVWREDSSTEVARAEDAAQILAHAQLPEPASDASSRGQRSRSAARSLARCHRILGRARPGVGVGGACRRPAFTGLRTRLGAHRGAHHGNDEPAAGHPGSSVS